MIKKTNDSLQKNKQAQPITTPGQYASVILNSLEPSSSTEGVFEDTNPRAVLKEMIPPKKQPRLARDILEDITISKLNKDVVARNIQSETISEDEALEKTIAKIMEIEGLTKPYYPPNCTKDTDKSPESITLLGETLHPYSNFARFGYYQHDRARHTHVMGTTGGGKSTLLENIVYQDIWFGRGGIYLDPHGDSAVQMLNHIPPWRIKDTIYLDFNDKQNFVGLNPLELKDPQNPWERQDAVDQVIHLLRRAVGLDGTAVRLMKYLTIGLSSLAFTPNMTILEIMPLFMNATFREAIKTNITDPELLQWWRQSFESLSPAQIVEETTSLENRIRPIINDVYVRGILGQNKTTLDFEDIMDTSKFLIVNLSKANTSEEFAKMFGTVLISRTLKAAEGRTLRFSGEAENQRRRFALIIDEFQNFLTGDIATSLEEARKYGLHLTLAHQTLGQVDEIPKIAKTLGTNIGNRLIYGVGRSDAKIMSEYMDPMTASDLANLPKWTMAAKIMIDQERSVRAFSALGIDRMKRLKSHKEIAKIVKDRSRALYTTPAEEVASQIETRRDISRAAILSAAVDDGESFLTL